MSNPNSQSNVEAIYPLSPLQQGMLVDSLYTTESGVYTVQLAVTLGPTIVAEAFRTAWQTVINRHPVLRTVFVWEHQKPLQIVLGEVELPWATYDWRHDPARAAKLADFLKQDQDQGFKLDQAPLMRCTLLQTSDEEGRPFTYFVWTLHHILMDAWCMSIVLKEVFALYEATLQGETLTLPAPRPYRDYITWLQQQDRPTLEHYWRQTLHGLSEPTPLPVTETVLNKGTFSDPYQRLPDFHLSAPLSNALRTMARQQRLTMSTLFQGAWALLLSRYTGQEDLLFGITVAGRPPTLAGAEGMVGLFINTLPARITTPPAAELLPWLQSLQQQQVGREAYAHSSLIDIQGWSSIPRSRRLFETILVYENYPMDPALFADQGGPVQALHYTDKINYPLCLVVEPGESLRLEARYDATLFSAATVTRLLGHLQSLLESMVAQPETRLGDLALLSAAEAQQALVDWNQTVTDYPKTQSIQALFAAQAARTPEAVAVLFPAEQRPAWALPQLTYGELNERANQLARHLQSLGVGPQSRVGICIERSVEMVIGLLGILKAGGAYVPLDPTYPQERLDFMLADTQIQFLLTQAHLASALPTHDRQIIYIDREWAQIARQERTNPVDGGHGEQLAYIMYTSGSTGKPKGICIPHRAVNRLLFNTNYIALAADDKVAFISNTAFDAMTFEVWGALLHGGQLVVIPKEVALTPQMLAACLRQYGVTTMFITTALFNQIAQLIPNAFHTLRTLLFGGEAVDVNWVRAVLHAGPPARLLHVYGPTESTTFSTWYWVKEVAEKATTVPIGAALANTQLYVVDHHLHPVPVGIVGELLIGGDGLADAYWERPELTAEKFIRNPFGTGRVYRTGDLVRWLPTGALEFVGRVDQQVKIRGFRIEPGEIEAVLQQHPAVRNTVVLAHEVQPGDKRLIAYVVSQAKQSRDQSAETLRTFLSRQLPEYMLPAAFVFVDALPLTPNGKIDRKNLPAPVFQTATAEDEQDATRTSTETTTAAIWCKVLDLDHVGLHDDFFDLGGHSLMATQIVSRMRDTFSVDLLLQDLFDRPTIAELAAYVDTLYLQTADSIALEQILSEVAPAFARS